MMGCYLSIYIYACGFNLLLCIMMLSKFCQILVHILVKMLLKYKDLTFQSVSDLKTKLTSKKETKDGSCYNQVLLVEEKCS